MTLLATRVSDGKRVICSFLTVVKNKMIPKAEKEGTQVYNS